MGAHFDGCGCLSITKKTYDAAVKRGLVHDFQPQSQGAIALDIIHHQGADQAIWDGNLDAAFALLNHRWSSLPGGSQQEITAERGRAYFADQLKADVQ